MRNFKFLRKNESLERTSELPQETPQFDISYRHWNLLPQDIKDGNNRTNMLLYIQGWESARTNDSINPYTNMDFMVFWNRGFTDYQIRISNPPISIPFNQQTYLDSYRWEFEEFEFVGVTPSFYNQNLISVRKRVYRDVNTDDLIAADIINSGHPMYNHPNIINF